MASVVKYEFLRALEIPLPLVIAALSLEIPLFELISPRARNKTLMLFTGLSNVGTG